MIADYLAIIPLTTAKNYLRIDDSLTADDDLIESMIDAALQYVEQYTNHILVEQNKTYYGNNDPWFCASNVYEIYDFPIVSVVEPSDPDDYTSKTFNTKTKYTMQSDTLELNLGYDQVSDIPQAFIQSALAILQVWYYNSEQQQSTALVPKSVQFALNPYRRFPLF
jgi:hypothetical protein